MKNHRSFGKLLLLISLLLILYAQLVTSAIEKSPTVDEPNHLTRGYVYLKTGKLRFTVMTGHPPLYNLLSATPLLLTPELGAPEGYPGWEGGFLNLYSTRFIFNNPVGLKKLFFLGRLVPIATTLCLAALLARWSRQLYGFSGSLITLFVCTFAPNLITHGRWVTTDIGVTFFLALSSYLFWRFLRRPTWLSLTVAGIAVGATLCVKYSSILLFPILGVVGLAELFRPVEKVSTFLGLRCFEPRWKRRLFSLAAAMVLVAFVAGLTLWAVYRFEVRPSTVFDWSEERSIPLPAPVYFEGIYIMSTRVITGMNAFLLGQRYSGGHWAYFPVGFALKTPLPILILLAGALIANVKKRPRWDEWALGVPAVTYVGVILQSTLNIGYRHMLPALPFLWVYVGRLGSFELGIHVRKSRAKLAAVLALLVLGGWLAAGTLSIWPDYTAYFNVFAGGPDNGWQHMVDSNLDWGQDFYQLNAFAAEHAETTDEPIYLSWFGCTYPYRYGVGQTYGYLPSWYTYPYEPARSPFNPAHPEPGWYAISATNLQGVHLDEQEAFARFREREPVAQIGHSILVYHVPSTSEPRRPTCIANVTLGDLDDETVAHSLGRGPGAVRWFDEAFSFVLPDGEETAYVLGSPALSFAPEWREGFVELTTITHHQTEEGESPDATVYALTDPTPLRESILDSLTPVTDWRVAGPAGQRPVETPVRFQHGLELAGYRLLSQPSEPGHPLTFATVWRATQTLPTSDHALKIFIHLLDADDEMVAVKDRLDMEPLTWQTGDLLIQYHHVPLPEQMSLEGMEIELGLYRGDTMERLTVQDSDGPIGDRVLLSVLDSSK